ncbi:MAG: hypothetical protein R6V58_05630, partial [Planctomycetota bacterium]
MKKWAVVLVAWFVSVPCLAGDFELELGAEEPAGVARRAAWARAGVPLVKGRFKQDQAFAVFADGKAVQAQVEPLVVDEDGFLRWVLVDVLADFKAGQKRTFTLRAVDAAPKIAAPLKVVNRADGLSVDTGELRFAIAKDKPFGLFSSVSVGGRPVVSGGEVSYVDATLPDAKKHKRYVAGPPETIELTHAGPVRVTARVTGRFVGDDQSKLRYIAWVTAWAGRSDVHVRYALANSNPDQYVYRRIGDSTIRLDLAGKVSGTVLGADGPIHAGPDARMKQGLIVKWYRYGGVQFADGAARAWDGGKEVWASKDHKDHPLGWAVAETAAGNVFACDRFFWENPARQLAVADGALVLTGVTERPDGPMRVWYK